DAYWAWWGGVTYSAAYKVNAQTAGAYKLWYRGSDPTNDRYDKVKLKVNGTDITSSLSKVTGTDFTVKVDPSGTPKNFACAFFLAEITLTSGVNNISYEITEKSTSGAKYAGLFDCMVIAPSSYEWEAPNISTKPEGELQKIISPDADGVYWIEESAYDSYENAADGDLAARVGTNGTAAANTTDLVSGGDAYWAWWGGVTYSAAYKVNAQTAGAYKLWYRGSDPTNDRYDKVRLKINGVDITASLSKVEGTDFTVKVDPSGTPKNFACAFFLTEITLTSGVNTITYEITEQSTNGAKYAGLFDCVVLAPSTYEWLSPETNTKPVFLDQSKFIWIEGEAHAGINGDLFSERVFDDTRMSGGKALAINTSQAPSEGVYYAEYELNIESDGIYDVFVRSSHSNGGDNISRIIMSVDGVVKPHSEICYDGWIEVSSGDDSFAVGWNKITLELTRGTHILRWAVKPVPNGRYAAVIDAVVFMPSSMDFTPKPADLAATKAEYELSALLCDHDLTNVSDDLILPAQTINGNAVVWTTSDPSIITDTGDISKDEFRTKTAVLTATIDGYSKDFTVKTACAETYRVENFGLSGDASEGNTVTASADITSLSADARNIVLIVAQYGNDDRLKSCNSEIYYLTENTLQTIAVELEPEDYAEGDYVKAFIWNDFENLNIITRQMPTRVFGKKLLPEQFKGTQSFHTELMKAYLNDTYDSVAYYVDGKTNVDKPEPITFKWSWNGGGAEPTEYILSVSENRDMSDPAEYTVSEASCDVYNLKIKSDYYWTVSAEDENGNTVISDVSVLRTENTAPRNIFVSGIKNVRDIGGWNTLDSKQVKQGYLYRCFRLSYMDNGTFKKQINDAGISTMRNVLGIKSEIDIRLEDEMPLEYTESVLGADVNYFREPMNYSDDYLSSNKEAIKNIFAE
ncbi:MAG: tyrosine-protein phosphatase, partial [Clostridia bacterium]|nr:tyrosine-protein phosphatase [Clostridia bacterium]